MDDIGSIEWEDLNFSNDLGIINKANNSLPLHILLAKYNINFENKYSTTGWTQFCRCPFKDHADSSPSFGYNSIKDCFNCFGCNRGGRSVQFLSYIKDISQEEAATRILHDFSSNFEFDDVEHLNIEKVETLLFEYADYIREFKKKYNNDIAIKYAEDVTWSLDVYLRKQVSGGVISIENLENRIIKLKEQLDVFED